MDVNRQKQFQNIFIPSRQLEPLVPKIPEEEANDDEAGDGEVETENDDDEDTLLDLDLDEVVKNSIFVTSFECEVRQTIKPIKNDKGAIVTCECS